MANFQRRHYQAIADVVRRLGDPDCRMDIAMMLADMFREDHEQFDVSKFLAACDVVKRGVRV